MPLLQDLRLAGRFARDLGPYLRTPVDQAACLDRLAASLALRREAFVTLVERAVFANPRSPYRPLFARAQIGPRELDGSSPATPRVSGSPGWWCSRAAGWGGRCPCPSMCR